MPNAKSAIFKKQKFDILPVSYEKRYTTSRVVDKMLVEKQLPNRTN